jgi:hypothetical protein
MPRISVLVPTHEHASTLRYAVRSVQAQGVDDLEILICGDGVGDELRAVVAGLQDADPRIRFFDLPKSPGIGELNRDRVMRQAKGRIICHHNDDDLWLPGHIEVLERALDDADFVGAMQVNVGTDGKVRGYYFDLERPEFVEPWLDWKPNNFGSWASNGFGPIFVAHRLDAFLRLPEGWTTTPDGLPPDQVMWHKFLRQPWCRAKFLRWPIALHFASSDRHDWTPEQRAEELRRWTEIIESPDYAARIWRDVMPDLGDRLLGETLRGPLRDIMAAHEAALEYASSEKREFIARIRELEAEIASVRAAAATQIAEFQLVFDATREATDERIRQLEHQVDAITAAALAQAMELQTMANAQRSVATGRIRELEHQVDAITAAASAQAMELQTRANAQRSAATGRIRELENQVDVMTRAASVRIIELQTRADAAEAALERERTLRAEAESERNAMLSSTSWRITAPLRRAVDWLRRFTSG